MSLKEALTEHANILRSKTGVSNSLSISDMTRLLGDLSWGKTNLIKGTSDTYAQIKTSGWATSEKHIVSMNGIKVGDTLTYSVTIQNNSDVPVRPVAYCLSSGDPFSKIKIFLGPDEVGKNQTKDTSITFTVVEGTTNFRTDVESISGAASYVEYNYKNERLYEGTEPGIWTPNPSDLTGGGQN